MKTKHVKMPILLILDKIKAYLHNKSHILKKSAMEKFHFSTTSNEKSAEFEDF